MSMMRGSSMGDLLMSVNYALPAMPWTTSVPISRVSLLKARVG
jgi:hypothetical protein